MLEHPREYRIFAEVALGIINLLGFELLGTQSKNFMIHFFISTINTTVYAGKKKSGSKYSLKPARGLAYWFMDDGTCKSYRSQNGKRYYVFSTQSFPKEDQSILIQALQDNFSITARS